MTENMTASLSPEGAIAGGTEGKVKKKILLVDDVKLFLELEKSFFLRNEAFDILTIGNGRDALEIVKAERPDLIRNNFV